MEKKTSQNLPAALLGLADYAMELRDITAKTLVDKVTAGLRHEELLSHRLRGRVAQLQKRALEGYERFAERYVNTD